MDKAEFLKRAAAGEQVCIVERLESNVANLIVAGETLDQQFSSREDAQCLGVENGLNPFSWQAVSDTSYYNGSKT